MTNARMERATVTIYFDRRSQQLQLRERLKQVAKREDRSINYVVNQAIREFVERRESENGDASGRGG